MININNNYKWEGSPFDSLFAEELLCTEEEVFDLLASLDTPKASGPDGLSARMLKSILQQASPPR